MCDSCDAQPELARSAELRGGISDALRSWSIGRQWECQEDKTDEMFDRRRETLAGVRQRREAQPGLGRMANGIADWLDDCRNGKLWTPDEKGLPRIIEKTANRTKRLYCIGNAQVPLCAATAFEILLQICNMTKTNNDQVEPVDGIDKRPRDAIERICFQLKELLLKKNADYGSAAFRTPYLNPNGTAEEAILTRLSDKYERLHNVLAKNAQVAELPEETIIDIAGYCVLFLANRELNKEGSRQ